MNTRLFLLMKWICMARINYYNTKTAADGGWYEKQRKKDNIEKALRMLSTYDSDYLRDITKNIVRAYDYLQWGSESLMYLSEDVKKYAEMYNLSEDELLDAYKMKHKTPFANLVEALDKIRIVCDYKFDNTKRLS